MSSNRPRDYTPPRATPAQLKVLAEVMQEVNVDLTRLFPFLTRNECDLLVKGVVVVSEVIRQTGQRYFHPRDLRLAVRYYLEDQDEDAEEEDGPAEIGALLPYPDETDA